MTRIYIAGPYSSRNLLGGYREELTRVGYVVRSRWLDGQHEVGTNPAVEAEASPTQRGGWALDDLEDIRSCDALVAFTSKAVGNPGSGLSGGRHVEMGYALAQHKSVLLVGEPENVFHWLPAIVRVPDWHEALIELAARLVKDANNQERIEAS